MKKRALKLPDIEPRIGTFTGSLMIGTALFFDFFQAIPIIGFILGWLVSIIALLTFFLWFKFCGVTFISSATRKLVTMFGGFFIEMLPLFNILPGWTLSVVLMLIIVRLEDKQRQIEARQQAVAQAQQLEDEPAMA